MIIKRIVIWKTRQSIDRSHTNPVLLTVDVPKAAVDLTVAHNQINE